MPHPPKAPSAHNALPAQRAVTIACSSSQYSPDEEIAHLHHELAAARQQLQQNDSKISCLQDELASAKQQLQQTTRTVERKGPSIENLRRFLNETVPTASRWLEDLKRHTTSNPDALQHKLGELHKVASKVKETAEQHQTHVQMQFAKLRDKATKVQLEISRVEEKLDISKWFEEDLFELLSYEFNLVKAQKLRAWQGGPLPKHQELRGILGASSLETVRISIRDLVSESALLKSILVVSHRWVKPGHPDPEGKQQAIIVRHLTKHPEIEYVWQDWWCLPQGKRTGEEQDYFQKSLEHVYMLFLGAQVLLLPDMQYLGRFWTSYETWLSMRKVSQDGFSPADDRVTIQCSGAAGLMEQSLRDTWGPLDINQAHANLSQADIVVTNKKDKDQQLELLQQLDRNLPALLSLLAKTPWKDFAFPVNLQSGYDPADTGFEVEIKKGAGDAVGLDVDCGDPTKLLVTKVKAGLVAQWNAKNPDMEVKVGDYLIAINGRSGNSRRLLDAVKNDDELKIMVMPGETCI